MLDPTNTQATAGSVSGNMPTLGDNQFGFFGMHTHPGDSTPSNQDNLMTQQLGLDQMVVGNNGTATIFTNNPSDNWQGAGFEFNGPITHDPVPGHNQLNSRNQAVGQGNGVYGTNRSGGRSHNGIDITSSVGTNVVAVGSGTVVLVNNDPNGYGIQIVIDHGDGKFSQSAHLDSTNVKKSDAVDAGQVLGMTGVSGNTPTNAESHLHFEIRLGSPASVKNKGKVDDPLNHLPGLYFQNGVLLNPGTLDSYFNNLGRSDDNRTTDQIGSDNMNAVLSLNASDPPGTYDGDTDANNAAIGSWGGGGE
jgi:Peptidase family M23